MEFKRDIMGELSEEIRKHDIKFIAIFHRQWFFGWYPTWYENTDALNPEYASLYGPKLKKSDFVYSKNLDKSNFDEDKYYPMAGKEFNDQ